MLTFRLSQSIKRAIFIFSTIYLVNSEILILICESFVNVLQNWEESNAGRTPGSEELHQHGVILIQHPGQVLEGIDGGNGGSLVPLAVELVLTSRALHNLDITVRECVLLVYLLHYYSEL